jgi:hypothetical protein
MIAVLSAAVSCAAAHAASVGSEDYVWKNVTVGGGGFVPGIVFSRAERGLAYIRTDIGGAYRWDASLSRWIPLEDGVAEGNYLGIESIAPDPVDPNIVYAAAGTYHWDKSAILKSRDRGATWKVVPVDFRMGGNEPGRGLGERLSIDPNDTSILYFGSRHDGLQRSADGGRTWAKVASFPVPGLGFPTGNQPFNAGIAFVVFDPASSVKGAPTRTTLVGVADPGAQHLFRSDDAGTTWKPVAGEPRSDLLPVQAQIDSRGTLYIAYSTSTGPNGVKDGAVFRYDTHAGTWTDITPDKSAKHPPGGYMGLSVDREHAGILVVATLNRYQLGDTIWRSTDSGATWLDLRKKSSRDVSSSPYLLWGKPQADFGWWIAGVAIDPFDPDHMAYATGATIYATDALKKADSGGPTSWHPWVDGIEETAILTLASPAEGPHLISGFGDIGGFAHEVLDKTPPSMFTNPVFVNTNTIDVAGMAPNVVVRSGTPARHDKDPPVTLAYSLDNGRTWNPIIAPPLKGKNARGDVESRRFDETGDAPIVTSADGSAFIVMTPVPLITRDRGQTWAPVSGLPLWAHAIADRANASRFYAFDLESKTVLASTDGGMNFAPLATTGLPADVVADWPTRPDTAWPFMATPGKPGDLWLRSRNRLYHSGNGGRSFAEVKTNLGVEALAFGKAARGEDYPALFTIAWSDQLRGVFRSDDAGKSWVRVNDDAHEYGRRFRCIAGDARVFGRVYVGTDGRGIVYGDPAKGD